jgi:hypothetical protein
VLSTATTVHVANDWLDYAAAFAGVGSLLLALVAAAIAIRSKADAERSADAAERTAGAAAATAELTAQMERRGVEQLKIMREEHRAFMAEQSRQPDIQPVLEIGGATTGSPLNIVVRSGATNVGSKTAEGVLVMTLVPQGVRVLQLDAKEQIVSEIALESQREQTLRRQGADYPAVGFGVNVDVRPKVFQTDNILLIFPGPDVYEIATRCHHHDIPGGCCWAVAQLNLLAVPLQWTQTERGTG